jgi:tetratricopeptide (TPR) repeat protein
VAPELITGSFCHVEGHDRDTFGHNGAVSDIDESLGDLRVRVKSIDAGLLGRRIRHARQRAGMTQGDAAGTDMSTAYISRIEAGQRRPGADLLVSLAERLRCTPDELLAPDDSVVTYDAAVVARLTLELDYADLELRTGSSERALERVEEVLAEATRTTAVPPEIVRQARLLRALALESTGERSRAIDVLEQVVAVEEDDPLRLLNAFTALSRCYRDSTDYARAADIGERAAGILDARQLTGTAEGLKLAVTVAAAHFERGDVNHAVRTCQRALASAEELDSPEARAAAYWNASIMESRQGRTDDALPLAHKALSLLEIAEDSRSQMRLRIQLGVLHLQSDPAHPEKALEYLRQAMADAEVNGINDADRTRARVGIAQATFMLGHLDEAADLLQVLLDSGIAEAMLASAEAHVLQARVASARGDEAGAVEYLGAAQSTLEGLQGESSAHGIAQLWFEIGDLLDQHGRYREAAAAYRSAGTTTGLTRVRESEQLVPATP